ncbi:protein kinase domain-containing protein [Stackebrandtia soli]|uniref:protein kinase domain-containing protein n=1 Tax=Stackebrandtia soli TaxID=1892856 RepID=UPI0039EB654A
MEETSGEQALVAGRYRLIEVIGRGGMGVVWHARDELIDRDIAVKQIYAPFGLGEQERLVYRQRALAEARNAGRINHAGVVAIHDIVPAQRDGDAVSLVMELIAAPTLEDALAANGPLSPERVLTIARGLWEALETAHAMGIVHRDVKPANIHLLPRDMIKLVDFGIAHTLDDPRLTRTGTMGTGPYMAPELFDGEAPHAGSDWWSLGVTLRHLVTGNNMFARHSPASTMRAIVVDPIPTVDCPPPLSTIIDGLLTRDPRERVTGAGIGELLAAGMPPRPGDAADAKGGTTKWPTGPTRRQQPDEGAEERHLRAKGRGEAGDYAGAIEEFADLWNDLERQFGPDDRATLTARYELARFRGEAGHYSTAIGELEDLIAAATRVWGHDDDLTFDARHELAKWRAEDGDTFTATSELLELRQDLEQAEDLRILCVGVTLAHLGAQTLDPFAAAEELRNLAVQFTKLSGPEHRLTLDVRHKQAQASGEFNEAAIVIPELERLREDFARVFGFVHPATLDVRHDLARLRREDETAIDELSQVLRDSECVLGAEHPKTLRTRRALADRRGKSGDIGAAREELERIRHSQERLLGAEHPEVFETRTRLAAWRGEADGPETAVSELEPLIAETVSALGSGHPSVFGIRMELATWRGKAEGPTAELATYEQTWRATEAALGPDHTSTLIARGMLLFSRITLDTISDADEFERSLSDLEDALGRDHFMAILCRGTWAINSVMKADDPIAESARLEPLLPDQIRVLGATNALTLTARRTLAWRHGNLGDPATAVAELARLRDDQEYVLGTDHPDTLATRRDLAQWRGAESGPQAAIADLEALLPDLERVLGPDHSDTLATRQDLERWRGDKSQQQSDKAEAIDIDTMVNLGSMAQKQGDLDEAEKWFRKAAEAGHTGAMVDLGLLVWERDIDSAEGWFRKAADAGEKWAMFNLGILLRDRGDLDDAEEWYRKAADAGHTGAMHNLGLLLRDRGDLDDAEEWLRRASDAGNTGAMQSLGRLLRDRGNNGSLPFGVSGPTYSSSSRPRMDRR